MELQCHGPGGAANGKYISHLSGAERNRSKGGFVGYKISSTNHVSMLSTLWSRSRAIVHTTLMAQFADKASCYIMRYKHASMA